MRETFLGRPYDLTEADGLFAEQVAVRPGAGQRQHQHIILDTVNEQPVRENVTFPMAHPIAGQIVIAVFIRQRFAHRQQRHDLFQQFDFQAALDCPLVVLFESCRVLDGVLCFSSFFQVGKQLVKVIVALYRRVFCNPFRFQHGSNRFLVGLFQLHLKGNAALTKRLAHEDVERRG